MKIEVERVSRLIRTIAWTTIILEAMLGAPGAQAGDSGASSPAAPAETSGTPLAPPPMQAPGQQAPSQPPTASQPPAAGAAPPNPGTPALVLDTQDYEGLLGKSVRAANGDDLGRIIDVIVDRDGRARAAIIDFGGFLGVGSRKIAVDWRVLKFSAEGKAGRLTLTLNRNQVRVSPEYKPGDPIVVLGSSSPGAAPTEAEPAAATAAVPNAAPAAPEKAPEK